MQTGSQKRSMLFTAMPRQWAFVKQHVHCTSINELRNNHKDTSSSFCRRLDILCIILYAVQRTVYDIILDNLNLNNIPRSGCCLLIKINVHKTIK